MFLCLHIVVYACGVEYNVAIRNDNVVEPLLLMSENVPGY